MPEPVVIQASINGIYGGRGKRPLTPPEITTDALACLDAGAAIIHNHIDRLDCSGEEAAARYLEGWQPVLAKRPDALFFPTGHRSKDKPNGLNISHVEPLAQSGVLRISYHDLGSAPLISKVTDDTSRGASFYLNSLDKVADGFEQLGRLRLGISVNIYEFNGLRTFLQWHHSGRLPQGCWINFYFSTNPTSDGSPGLICLPPTEAVLEARLDLLRTCPVPWGACLFGGDIVRSGLGGEVVKRGGHLIVGLEQCEDPREPSNRELVQEAVDLCRTFGRRPATSAEAAAIFDIPIKRPRSI